MALFGFHSYLKIISFIFLKTFFSNIKLSEHKQVRFLGKLVNEGDTCIDIGANLGYFSLPLAHLVGNSGKVYSVEPVEAFRKVLQGNIQKFGRNKPIEVLPYALGDVDNKKINMGTPKVDGVVRHGRTEVLEDDGNSQAMAKVHEAVMFTPTTLFADLKRLDFIKCDVEGYELHIVPHLVNLIKKFQPILEIEIDPLDHKRQLIELFRELEYFPYFLSEDKLTPFHIGKQAHQREIELYFLNVEHQQRLKGLIHTP